jgi:hypothetical protein
LFEIDELGIHFLSRQKIADRTLRLSMKEKQAILIRPASKN